MFLYHHAHELHDLGPKADGEESENQKANEPSNQNRAKKADVAHLCDGCGQDENFERRRWRQHSGKH